MGLGGGVVVSFGAGRTRRPGGLVSMGGVARKVSMLAVVREVRRKKPESGLGGQNIDGVLWEGNHCSTCLTKQSVKSNDRIRQYGKENLQCASTSSMVNYALGNE